MNDEERNSVCKQEGTVQTIKTEVRYFNETVISLLRQNTFRIHVNTNLSTLLENNRCLL